MTDDRKFMAGVAAVLALIILAILFWPVGRVAPVDRPAGCGRSCTGYSAQPPLPVVPNQVQP